MSDVDIRIDGAAGRITLTRPEALNALSHEMCLAIDAALARWQHTDAVALVLIDALGTRAFCAGGDIYQLYSEGIRGDYGFARQFWRDEYRMNLRLANYPKPVVSLMQGLVIGGGVGLGCHGAHRLVCETTRISLPEVGIGLVPDAGASWILAQAPGFLGEFLGLSGAAMGPGDALEAGFADQYLPQGHWGALVARLCDGDLDVLRVQADQGTVPPAASLSQDRGWIDAAFDAPDMAGIVAALQDMQLDAAQQALAAIRRNSPLSMACTLTLIRSLRAGGGVALALAQEFRFAYRAMMLGDFLEGIRAAIIDRDTAAVWRHDDAAGVSSAEVAEMLAPLGDEELRIGEEHP